MKKVLGKLKSSTKKGFDGLIVTVGLILLVMILIFSFNYFIMPTLKGSIQSTATEIEQLNDWENGAANVTNP